MSAIMELEIQTSKGVSGDEPVEMFPPFPLEIEQTGTISPALPEALLLGALRDPRLRLIAPLTITFERENNDIVAYCEELEEFGFGKHLTEAIEDLQTAIAEVYFTLKEEKDRLGSDLSALLDTYYKKIKEVL